MGDNCVRCDGCGCPACIGTGLDVRELVDEWGDLNGRTSLKPESHPSLPVSEQYELRDFIRKRTR